MKVTAILTKNQNGTVTGMCPEIPGCHVTGFSENDAKKKMKAAIKGCVAQLLLRAGKRRSASSG